MKIKTKYLSKLRANFTQYVLEKHKLGQTVPVWYDFYKTTSYLQ